MVRLLCLCTILIVAIVAVRRHQRHHLSYRIVADTRHHDHQHLVIGVVAVFILIIINLLVIIRKSGY